MVAVERPACIALEEEKKVLTSTEETSIEQSMKS